MSDDTDTARLRLLLDLGRAFAAQIEIGELIPLVLGECRQVFDAAAASVLLLDPERNVLNFHAAADDPDVVSRLRRLKVPADRGIAAAILRNQKAEWVPDVTRDPRFYGEVDRETGTTTHSILGAPLRLPRGCIGVVQVMNPRGGGGIGDGDVAFIEALAGGIAVALENARLYDDAKASAQRLQTQVGVLRRDLARQGTFAEIIGTAPCMRDVFRLIESAAPSAVTVLIEGETGTGKELVARAVHRAGPRAEGPFVAVNCAALPESLLESELFGHRKGAFTGALRDRRGLFEAADGGTIFLDEVGEMPLPMQAKLLRVLQDGEVTPIGDDRPHRVDVRVVAATNRELLAEVRRHAFREDLYYRLSTFPIVVPPLRARREDIPLMIEHFVAAAAKRQGKRVTAIDPIARGRLGRFHWPGNVRELENEIERAVALVADGGTVGEEHLSAKTADGAPPDVTERAAARAAQTALPLRQARAAFEARYIADALSNEGNNVTRAARVLGLSRVMLQKKMKEYGLREPR